MSEMPFHTVTRVKRIVAQLARTTQELRNVAGRDTPELIEQELRAVEAAVAQMQQRFNRIHT